MPVKSVNQLSEPELSLLFHTLLNEGSFHNVLDMKLHLQSREYRFGRECFVLVDHDRIRGVMGIITKHTTKTGEVCIPFMETAPPRKENAAILLDHVLRYIRPLRPSRLKAGLSPGASELAAFLEERQFTLADRVRVLSARPSDLAFRNEDRPPDGVMIEELHQRNLLDFRMVYNRAFAQDPHVPALDTGDVEHRLLLSAGSGSACILYDHRQPCGVSEWEAAGPVGWIETIAVHPECRRKGHASRLLRHASLALARDRVSEIRLRVYESNFSALEFYREFRFEPIDIHSLWYVRSLSGSAPTSSSRVPVRGRRVKK